MLTLLRSDTGVIEEVCDPVPVPDGPLELRLETTPDGRGAQFRWRATAGTGPTSALYAQRRS